MQNRANAAINVPNIIIAVVMFTFSPAEGIWPLRLASFASSTIIGSHIGGFYMPIYEYKCPDCDHEFEALQSFSEEPLTICPECSGNKVSKLISRTSFMLKGGGWYNDHYGLKSSSPSSSSQSSDSGDSKNSSSTD